MPSGLGMTRWFYITTSENEDTEKTLSSIYEWPFYRGFVQIAILNLVKDITAKFFQHDFILVSTKQLKQLSICLFVLKSSPFKLFFTVNLSATHTHTQTQCFL